MNIVKNLQIAQKARIFYIVLPNHKNFQKVKIKFPIQIKPTNLYRINLFKRIHKGKYIRIEIIQEVIFLKKFSSILFHLQCFNSFIIVIEIGQFSSTIFFFKKKNLFISGSFYLFIQKKKENRIKTHFTSSIIVIINF